MADDIGNDPGSFREQAMADAPARPILYEEFYFLLGRYPYLELSHIDATHYPTTPPVIKKSSVGWDIHTYDQLMVSSQSALLSLLLTGVDMSQSGIETQLKEERLALRRRLKAKARSDAAGEAGEGEGETDFVGDEDDSGRRERKPAGTIVNQFFNTALEMVGLARAAGWPGVRIVRGYYPMQRAAWIACESQSLRCKGFEPTPEDHVVYSWVNSLSAAVLQKASIRPSRR